MHWIQKHILRQLAVHDSRRYSELKPPDVDGNLFMYHMQQLRQSGYVAKNTRSYVLSGQGRGFVGRMSLGQGAPLVQPKLVVVLVCQNAQGNYLLFRWRRQPYFGLVSFPFSKVHFGKTLRQTLEEALYHKANLRGTFRHVGGVSVRVSDKDGQVCEHLLMQIYRVTHVAGALWADGLTGEPFWGQPEDVPVKERAPGFMEILLLLQSGEPGFLKEIDITTGQ